MVRHPGRLLTFALLFGCRDGTPPTIHFVGLEDGPCSVGGTGGDAQVAPASRPTILFGTVPLRVAPWSSAELRSVRIKIGDDSFALPSPAAVHSFETTKRPDGTLTLGAGAEDSDGNQLAVQVRVCLDNHGPSLELESPLESTQLWAEDAALAVRWKATDQVGLDLLEASLAVRGVRQTRRCPAPDAGGRTSCLLEPAAMALKLAPGAEEQASLRVLARDQAGHEAVIERKLALKTRLKWALDLQGSVRWPAERIGSNRIAVATEVGRVVIIDTKARTILCDWFKPAAQDPSNSITTPLSATKDGATLYFGSYYNVWALSTADCKPPPPSPLYTQFPENLLWLNASRPALRELAGKTVVLVGLSAAKDTSKGTLRAIDGQTGEVLGSLELTKTAADITSSPLLAESGATVFLGAGSDLHAIDVGPTGQLAPRTAPWPVKAKAAIRGRPLFLGGHLYASTSGAEILGVQAASGMPIAGFPVTLTKAIPPTGVGGAVGAVMLYLGSEADSGLLLGIKTTGGTANEIEVGQIDTYSYPVVSFEGGKPVLYAATKLPARKPGVAMTGPRGRLYSVSSDLSTVYWYFETEHGFVAAPTTEGSNVYIGNSDGFLYLLDTTL